MPRRTVRKPTRWTPEEWNQVETEARARGVPPLRYVREAALGRPPAPRRARGGDELVKQLARVLNNLRQLQHVAEVDGDEGAATLLQSTAAAAEAAIRAVPAPGAGEAAALLAELVPAGVALNELAHRANAAEELPAETELLDVLAGVEAALRRIGA